MLELEDDIILLNNMSFHWLSDGLCSQYDPLYLVDPSDNGCYSMRTSLQHFLSLESFWMALHLLYQECKEYQYMMSTKNYIRNSKSFIKQTIFNLIMKLFEMYNALCLFYFKTYKGQLEPCLQSKCPYRTLRLQQCPDLSCSSSVKWAGNHCFGCVIHPNRKQFHSYL